MGRPCRRQEKALAELRQRKRPSNRGPVTEDDDEGVCVRELSQQSRAGQYLPLSAGCRWWVLRRQGEGSEDLGFSSLLLLSSFLFFLKKTKDLQDIGTR